MRKIICNITILTLFFLLLIPNNIVYAGSIVDPDNDEGNYEYLKDGEQMRVLFDTNTILLRSYD